MLFNVEADRGAQIVGYFVPDDFTATPSLRIVDQSGEIAVVACNEARPSLVVAGRHATGQCGFNIDESIVPNITGNDTLALYDADTGLLVYRRRNSAQVVHERILRIETHLFPLWRLDNAVEHKFQYFHKGVERYGRETATQMFLLKEATSLYISGRLSFKAYETYTDDEFKCVVILHEPYEELAERLLTLKHVKSFGDELLGARDMVAFDAAIEFAQELRLDEAGLRRAFDAMPKAVIGLLTNPVTRQLTQEAADSAPVKGAVGRALDALSRCAIVGIREHQAFFVEQLEELCGLAFGGLPDIASFPAVAELAGLLRRIPEVELLIEQDLEVYFTVQDAIRQSLRLEA